MNAKSGSASYSYDEAKELARSDDPLIRAALAARADLAPELLYFLASDQSADVRIAVAQNDAAPRQTDMLLATDADVEVRGRLAAKIAKVAPGLSPEESNKIRAQTYEALTTLAHDQMTVVRAVLSEALKDVVDAPHDVIKSLAHDLAIEVSGPVLEFSPVLTEQDLIEIIKTEHASGSVAAVARRNDVTENLADAIIGTDDIEGIADLLGNDSAQIREEALNDLVNRSSDCELWQAPLMSRRKLPDGAAQRMAGFLAGNMLDALRQREDLDDDALDTISEIVQERFGRESVSNNKVLAAGFDFLKVEPPVGTARRLHEGKKLTPEVVMKALQAGDHAFVFAALIVRADVPVPLATKIFVERSPKGIAALIAKAGLGASMLVMTQQQMGRIAPGEIIEPTADNRIPLSAEEVAWQMDFYEDMIERG